jgi:hypothetical protein
MLTIHFKRSMISSLYIFIYSSSIYNSWKRISYILAQSCSKNSLSRMDGTHGELLLIISSLSCQLQCASRFCNKPYQWQYIGMRRNTNTTLFHLTLLLRYFLSIIILLESLLKVLTSKILCALLEFF